MAVDVTDPKVLGAYNEIVDGALTDWLLLGYGQTPNKLSLYETGSRGIDELRQHLGDEVLFGFVRVDEKFCLIAYMPENVSGVKRARALVHSRAVGNAFKAHQAVLNASKSSDVDIDTIMEKLGLIRDTSAEGSPIIGNRSIGATLRGPPPVSSHVKATAYAEGMPPTPPSSAPRHSQTSGESRPNRQSSSASTAAQQRISVDSRMSSTHGYQQRMPLNVPEPVGTANAPAASTYSSALDGTRAPAEAHSSRGLFPPLQMTASVSTTMAAGSLPEAQAASTRANQSDTTPSAREAEPEVHAPFIVPGPRSTSLDGPSALAPRAPEVQDDGAEELPPPPPPKESSYLLQGSPRVSVTSAQASPNAQQSSAQSGARHNGYHSPDGRPAQSYAESRSTPPRTEAQIQAALSRAKWEAEAQATSSKAQLVSQYDSRAAEEEHIWHGRISHDRTQVDEEDLRRAQLEEAQQQEAARRLRLERERRAEEVRRLREKEETARQLQRQKAEAALEKRRWEEAAEKKRREEEEAKRAQQEQWKAAKAAMQEKFKQLQGAGKVMLTGWASHQVGLIWRRRYFELRPDSLLLFKDSEGAAQPVLGISVSSIRSVTDARDELELPNSLKVDLRDREPAFFYCDSAEDKEVFLTALRQAAKL